MEQLIDQIIQQGPIGIICASVVYLIIYFQRKSTSEKRDADSEQMKAKIIILENEIEQIKALDLAGRLASIETSLKYIQMLLEQKEK